jgi:hypothetical protein
MINATYGTGCFILMNTGAPVVSHNQLLTTVDWTLQRNTDLTPQLKAQLTPQLTTYHLLVLKHLWRRALTRQTGGTSHRALMY